MGGDVTPQYLAISLQWNDSRLVVFGWNPGSGRSSGVALAGGECGKS